MHSIAIMQGLPVYISNNLNQPQSQAYEEINPDLPPQADLLSTDQRILPTFANRTTPLSSVLPI